MIFLEVIATCIADVVAINETQANRIELCTNMNQDGLIADYELIKASCALSKIPIRIMVRRSNKAFNISEKEFLQLLADVEFIKATKAEGIVCGILLKNNSIDVRKMAKLVEFAKPLHVSFHRAFDQIINQRKALKIIANLGIDTVLTSGGTKPIIENTANLLTLKNLKLPIKILLGSGLNSSLINNFKNKGFAYFHVGKCVRQNNSYEFPILSSLINKILC